MHDFSHMQQCASPLLFGGLVNTSGLVHPGLLRTSTAVFYGDMVSPRRDVHVGEVASTTSIPQPPLIQTQACRTHNVLPG